MLPARWTPHLRRLPCLLGIVVALSEPAGTAAAGEAGGVSAHWRVFRAADGLAESLSMAITASPRGQVWIKHGEVNAVSGLDGYEVRRVPTPVETIHRVYQSRAGRLWALYEDGVLGFTSEEWTRYPLTHLLSRSELNLLRLGRPAGVVPAEEDRLLIAFPERLVLFRAVDHSLTELLRADDTPLRRFLDLTAAASRGLWLAGERGLARTTAPLRQLGPDASWQFHSAPETAGIRGLWRPFEDDAGGVTLVAELVGEDRRGFAYFSPGESRWQVHTLPEENVRFAWRGREPEGFWVVTANRLLHGTGTNIRPVIPPVAFSRIFDVAVQPRGVFWLATREGVVRYAPAAWRLARAETGAVRGLATDAAGTLWAASDTGLWRQRDGAWSRHAWPTDFEPEWGEGDGIFPLGNNLLFVTAGRRAWRFVPGLDRFEAVQHPEQRQVLRVVRRAEEDAVLVLTRPAPERTEQDIRFERSDGRSFEVWREGPEPPTSAGEVFFLARSRGGDWWVGTRAGPGWWRDGRWQFFGPADGYEDEGALLWLELEDGRIWCAGLNRLQEFDGRRWTALRRDLDHVNAVLRASDGSVWLGTNLDLHRLYRSAWLAVGQPEGLPAPAVYAVIEDARRRIWVGTGAGLVEYVPRADFDPPRTLAIEWEQSPTATGEGSGRLRFTGRDRWRFTPDERLVFAYRLDEGEWSAYQPEPVARLRGLAQGWHRVEVRAMDRNWNVELRPPRLEFRVLVPWYRDQRVLLAGLLGLGLAAVAAGVAVNRHLRLRRSYADVERQVEERTRELRRMTAALAHSQKMTALGTLAAGIAHDFNNILSIIKGSAQIIAAQPGDRDKVLTRVSRILTMVDQASDVVRGMLGFGTATDRTVQPCDLNDLVTGTVRLLSDRFRRDVDVRLHLAPRLPRALAAADLVRQILLNLLFNGADAMDGRGVLDIRTAPLDAVPADLVLAPRPASRYVRVSVRDFGCGIPAEVRSRLFEPFFTTKARSDRPGRGLGLYMVYEFAREMGHGLQVESTPGQGSTFTLILPAAEEAASSTAPSESGGN